ncbi:MAG: hypothetical protein EOS58_31725 [Mesorhizobium sp.]|nr:MAG: hypothetical protein EOS58_31725 [Mesorhizobium sp.]
MTDKPAKTYKIVRLESENVKRLKAVSISPDGNIVEITGRNKQGKTSLLDSVWWGLTGKSASKQPSPIRAGEEKATIKLDLGSLSITRRFIAQDDGTYTHTLIVESEEGARFQKPQNVLDQLVGELTMDPLEFTKMKPDVQFDALRRFVPGFDFDKNAADNDKDFKARTDVNRRAKEARAQAAGIVVADGTPNEPIDESALIEELQDAGTHNADIEKRRANRAALQLDIDRRADDVLRARDQIEELKRQIAAKEQGIAADEAWISEQRERLQKAGKLPAQIDQSEITAKIAAARRINEAVAEKNKYLDLLARAEALELESAALTKAMADRDAEKAKAIAGAKMPVDGIGFGDGIITLNGQPFDQASQAEQIDASMAIAMAANSRLRVVLIRDAALLDDDSWQAVVALAEKYDCQVWLETVNSDRAGAIVIEDGSILQEKTLEAAE